MGGVDRTQWVEQYRRLEKPLYNVVYRFIWDASESQDIVQEAFLRCWERRRDIYADGFRALVFRVALNIAKNRRRRRKLWQMVGLESVDEPTAGNEPVPVDVPKPVRAAFDALPEGLRAVLLLTEVAGMTYGETAAVLGVREGTVGSRRTRALEALRERLDSLGVKWDDCRR